MPTSILIEYFLSCRRCRGNCAKTVASTPVQRDVVDDMSLISTLRQVYTLDTLDTRFTTSSATPLKSVDDTSATKAKEDTNQRASLPRGATPSRWNTWEFYFYGLVFVICVPQMYWAVWEVSQPSHPNYKNYEHLLSPGWLLGRKVDNSDGQYAGFRDNIPYLAALLIVHPLLRRAYDLLTQSDAETNTSHANGPADAGRKARQPNSRLQHRLCFDLVTALLFITALHGFSAFKVLLILYINFTLTTSLPPHLIPTVTWIFNISILFANELARGYRYQDAAAMIEPFYGAVANWGKFLDSYGGLIPRWEVLFNITVLRLISFNLDYYWSLDRDRAGSPVEVSTFKATTYPRLTNASTRRNNLTLPT